MLASRLHVLWGWGLLELEAEGRSYGGIEGETEWCQLGDEWGWAQGVDFAVLASRLHLTDVLWGWGLLEVEAEWCQSGDV